MRGLWMRLEYKREIPQNDPKPRIARANADKVLMATGSIQAANLVLATDVGRQGALQVIELAEALVQLPAGEGCPASCPARLHGRL